MANLRRHPRISLATGRDRKGASETTPRQDGSRGVALHFRDPVLQVLRDLERQRVAGAGDGLIEGDPLGGVLPQLHATAAVETATQVDAHRQDVVVTDVAMPGVVVALARDVAANDTGVVSERLDAGHARDHLEQAVVVEQEEQFIVEHGIEHLKVARRRGELVVESHPNRCGRDALLTTPHEAGREQTWKLDAMLSHECQPRLGERAFTPKRGARRPNLHNHRVPLTSVSR